MQQVACMLCGEQADVDIQVTHLRRTHACSDVDIPACSEMRLEQGGSRHGAKTLSATSHADVGLSVLKRNRLHPTRPHPLEPSNQPTPTAQNHPHPADSSALH